MRPRSTFVVAGVFVLFYLVTLAQGNRLYAVTINRNSPINGLLPVYPVQTATVSAFGEMRNFTTNGECFLGARGISALDTNRGILYFWDGCNQPRILATDLKNKAALPPTELPDVDYISDFAYDNVQDRMFLFYVVTDKRTLATFKDGKLQNFWNPPDDLRVWNVGLNQEDQQLLMITDTPSGPLSFTVLDLATLQTKSFALSDQLQSHIFYSRIVWSPTQKKAFIFSYAPHPNTYHVMDIYVTAIDPTTESTESILLQVPYGLFMDCAIDPPSNRIYFTELINMGYLYFEYDIIEQVALHASVVAPRHVEPLSLAVGPSIYPPTNSDSVESQSRPTVSVVPSQTFEEWKAQKRWQ